MTIFLRYLMSLVAHIAWHRMGRGGPVPPLRIPGKRTVKLPVISSWQIMAAMWLANKMWNRYGERVKTRLSDAGHPWVRQAGSLLPDTAPVTTATVSAPAMTTPTAPAPSVSRDTQPLPQPTLTAGSVLSSLHRPFQKGATS